MNHVMLFFTIAMWGGLFCAPHVYSQNLENQVTGITICGEQDTLLENQIYRTWISLNRNPYKVSGYLSQVSDLSILILSDIHGMLDLQINDIESISIRKKNSQRRGLFTGVAMGIVIGAVIGYSQGDDDPNQFLDLTAENKALLGGAAGFFSGALIGGALGSIKIIFPINGSIEKYNNYKPELEKRVRM